ncbi:MAG TPA: tRNA (adenosine(37)-N6)-threonylcarbamoyltransferase complex ATPase subunit type 1 TsaE [Candidatus Acidoferrum sp.]|nr:tRNA (adenosine(37)-N6)-threonylcarbamoyltransferase complex ATPase subunit type 1 TsaE [Candidatus Acidoferrum sp.]
MVQSVTTQSLIETQALGEAIGRAMQGGEVFEFISDVGGGKTTFVKGLARGLGVGDVVQSPTYTISRLYQGRDGLELHHFDFYRLEEAGVVAAELAESLAQQGAIVAVEWGELVHNVLPAIRATLSIASINDETRRLTFDLPKEYNHIRQTILNYKTEWHLV